MDVVRYERAKKFRASVFPSSPTGDLRPDIDENPEGILPGEWLENFSLLSYDDLRAYLETEIASETMKPSALLGEVMSTQIRTAKADQTLEEIDHHFEVVSGLPVIDESLKCIRVISKKDKAKASEGVMTKQIRTAKTDYTLEEIDHHFEVVSGLPVIDESLKCVRVISKKDKAKASKGHKIKFYRE